MGSPPRPPRWPPPELRDLRPRPRRFRLFWEPEPELSLESADRSLLTWVFSLFARDFAFVVMLGLGLEGGVGVFGTLLGEMDRDRESIGVGLAGGVGPGGRAAGDVGIPGSRGAPCVSTGSRAAQVVGRASRGPGIGRGRPLDSISRSTGLASLHAWRRRCWALPLSRAFESRLRVCSGGRSAEGPSQGPSSGSSSRPSPKLKEIEEPDSGLSPDRRELLRPSDRNVDRLDSGFSGGFALDGSEATSIYDRPPGLSTLPGAASGRWMKCARRPAEAPSRR